MPRLDFAVWVLEFSSLENGGDVDNADDWYEELVGIFWTRKAALAYLCTSHFGAELFQTLAWWYPYTWNLDYMQCGYPGNATRGVVLHKTVIQ